VNQVSVKIQDFNELMVFVLKFLLLLSVVVSFSACQFMPERKDKPAQVKDATLETKLNPKDQQKSIIETMPLMNNATRILYNQAKRAFEKNEFNGAINALERAYQIQPNSPEVTQLLAEISLHEGSYKRAHYWASIATKNGPSKGKVCEKSWRILAIAAEQLGYFANQAMALEQQANCLVKELERF
jgi:predicted Zn-dependent protease